MNGHKVGRLRISLGDQGCVLPVFVGEHGHHELVPVKPIIELFGMKWTEERRSITRPVPLKRFGICVIKSMRYDRPIVKTCIRVDRISALILDMDTVALRAKGHGSATDFIEKKRKEVSTRTGISVVAEMIGRAYGLTS